MEGEMAKVKKQKEDVESDLAKYKESNNNLQT